MAAYMILRNGEYLAGFHSATAPLKNAVPFYNHYTEGSLMFTSKRAATSAANKANRCEHEVVEIFRRECGYVRTPLLAEVVSWR